MYFVFAFFDKELEAKQMSIEGPERPIPTRL